MKWLRNFHWRRFLGELYDKVFDTALFDRAAQVAFYFSFAFFPLLLVLLTIFGLILDQTDSLQTELYSYLGRIMPQSAYQLVRTTMDEVIANSSGGKLTIGIIATLWSASAGVDSLRNAMNAVYEIRESWPWWKLKAQSLLLTILFILLLAAGLVIVTAGVRVAEKGVGAAGLGKPYSTLLIIAQWVALFAMMLFTTGAVYSWLPGRHRFRWLWITPGALVAILLWVILTVGFRSYLHFFNSYNKAYGSLGAVIILMLWMYLTALAVLIGGAINSVLTEMSHSVDADAENHPGLPATPPS